MDDGSDVDGGLVVGFHDDGSEGGGCGECGSVCEAWVRGVGAGEGTDQQGDGDDSDGEGEGGGWVEGEFSLSLVLELNDHLYLRRAGSKLFSRLLRLERRENTR